MATKSDPLPLPVDNLGSRHRVLNKRVNDAAANNVDFTTVKDEIEMSEVDRLFKIDLAAKCENVEYIVEMLKTGDTLHVTRALKKSQWIYDDKYSHIINPEYLDANIFPVTCTRVKRIILKTVAMRVRRVDRAIAFFKYCMKTDLPDIAFKYLLFTSEAFKLEIMQNHNTPPYNKMIKKKKEYFKFIIGKSLTLLEAYLKMKPKFHESVLVTRFTYLYPVNSDKYLELCEKYVDTYYLLFTKFNKQLCNDIMTKNKERVLAKPNFYMELIDEEILVKNSTVDDIKVYLNAVLPSSADGFWGSFVLRQYSAYLNIIPETERYAFLKQLFCDKYPGEDFEMAKCFYTQHYYQYLSAEEREEWAWRQIKSDKQVLGVGKDYLWYKFVNFKDAFDEIKNYVIVTKDAERRKGIIKVLIYSAKNNRELEILFKHYHRRHNNELRSHKEYFLGKVLEHHNVFEFDEGCWNAFYKLLLGLELYNTLDFFECNKHYKTIALFYYIAHEKDLPEGLSEYLLEHFYPYTASYWDNLCILKLANKLTEQKRNILYNFLFTFYIERFIELKNKSYNIDVYNKIARYFDNVLKLMSIFNPFSENEEPKCDLDSGFIPAAEVPTVDTSLSGRKLLRQLRKDKALVDETLLDVKKRFENSPFNIDGFLKKIKIYFPDDVTETFMTLLDEVLTKDDLDQKSVEACVKAIFELGDNNEVEEFMKKYAPKNAKIDHNIIDPKHLRIQKAICMFACIPRPPVSLSTILLYMKGDYVKYCLHLFNTYPAILPPSKCIEFVNALVDAPVSIQKHALRLSFKCFDAQKLKQISLDYWKNTKNVSIRCVLYKGLFNRLVEREEKELYDALKPLTLDLQYTDQKIIFSLIDSNRLSDEYLWDFKEAAWTAVSNFKDKQPNIQRKCNLLVSIREQIHLMREEFVSQIVEEHVPLMLDENSNDEIKNLYAEKWNLTAMYILHFAATRDVIDKYLETAQFVFKKYLENYYENCCQFFRQLKEKSLCPRNPILYENTVPVFESILKVVESDSPLFKSYMLRWELQLAIINRKVVKNYRQSFGKAVKSEVVEESLHSFSQEVGMLVSSMVNNKVYFVTHSINAKDAISDSVKDLLDAIYLESDEDQANYINKALITFTRGLLKFEIAETYFLAIHMLPEDCEECLSNKYQVLIDKLKGFSNPEVQYALHQRFSNPEVQPALHQKLTEKCKREPDQLSDWVSE